VYDQPKQPRETEQVAVAKLLKERKGGGDDFQISRRVEPEKMEKRRGAKEAAPARLSPIGQGVTLGKSR